MSLYASRGVAEEEKKAKKVTIPKKRSAVVVQDVGGKKIAKLKVGVALTTIPSRMKDVHHVIRSWLMQKGGGPEKILIFVPTKYQRFQAATKDKGGKDVKREPKPFPEILRALLSVKYKPLIENKRIEILPTRLDYGPITKFVGLLENWKGVRKMNVDNWVIGDDDVFYDPNVLDKYEAAFTAPQRAPSDLFTHFSVDDRVTIKLQDEEKPRAIRHIQGVDTFSVSNNFVKSEMHTHGALFFPKFTKMVRYLHKICPASFYQDDYVISFAANIAGMNVTSLWDDKRVAGHIDAVSKDNHQLHMSDKVHERETQTKECLVKNADAAAKLLREEWTIPEKKDL